MPFMNHKEVIQTKTAFPGI